MRDLEAALIVPVVHVELIKSVEISIKIKTPADNSQPGLKEFKS
jgi:hypothetical protein